MNGVASALILTLIAGAATVYLTSELDQQIGNAQSVNHGEFALSPTDTVSNGNYIFQGWFYTDTVDGEAVEKAFVFNGIPVLQDMNIYAKWSSHVSVSYTIISRRLPQPGGRNRL